MFLPRGRAKRLVVGMCDEFDVSHNELRIEYGTLSCCTCYGCPPMLIGDDSQQQFDDRMNRGRESYHISGSK
jgi:hypothetical protein